MNIHGLRIYPQSVTAIQGNGAPIFVHGKVAENCSDFFYAFRPLASVWRGHFFATDFCVSFGENGLEDPIPGLRKQFGSAFVGANLKSQLMLLKGDDFPRWGTTMHFCEGAFLPIFPKRPAFSFLNRIWSREFCLTSKTWPKELRAVLHMWDDIYWQLFTTDPADIDILIRAHTGDPKLKMYFVDLDREFPGPSNEELQVAAVSHEP